MLKTITGYKNCLICNKEFPYRDTLLVKDFNGVKSIKAKYCSRKCSDIATAQRNKNKIWTDSDRKKCAINAKKVHTGRKCSTETRQKMSENNSGSKSHFWKGGVSKPNKMARSTMELKEWRRQVFIRDDFTCQECGEKGFELNAHHIKSWSEYPELRYELSNGITLCIECHKKTDNYKSKGKHWTNLNKLTLN